MRVLIADAIAEESPLGFVVCPSYHGATLLALLLNNHSTISALGDTNPSREYDQVCSCLAHVSNCEFWQAVVSRLSLDRYAANNSLLPELPWPMANKRLDGGRIGLSRNAAINRGAGRLAALVADLVLPLLWGRRSRFAAGYTELWSCFYALVAELHGTSLVIDGTKSPRKVALLASRQPTGKPPAVIHLVRDPRGFAASSARYEGDTDMRRYGWLWRDLHSRIEALRGRVRYLRVRYEDLALRPKTEVQSICEFLGVKDEDLVGPPRFPGKHHLMGNKMMFEFNGTVRVDERWRNTLDPREQATALHCAGWLAERYGYV